jgi:hypothetical protein
MAMAEVEIESPSGRDGSGRFEKGCRPVGRKPGSQNKATMAVKDALLQAFDEVGGVDYLVQVAKSDPRTFCMLLAKLLPAELKVESGDDGVPLVVIRDYTGGKRPA